MTFVSRFRLGLGFGFSSSSSFHVLRANCPFSHFHGFMDGHTRSSVSVRATSSVLRVW